MKNIGVQLVLPKVLTPFGLQHQSWFNIILTLLYVLI